MLIVGCGCRGQALARDLIADGHVVRGTTRRREGAEAIRDAGAEPFLGDPDRIVTLMPALAAVTVVCWLLGSAAGEPAALAQLHGSRLTMLFEKLVDTPVRGVVYEAAGTVPAGVLAGGADVARAARATWHIPLAILDADPTAHDAWRAAARAAVGELIDGSPPPAPAR